MTGWHIYVIAVAAWLLSYIKIPFKRITKQVADDTVRKRINKLIILLPIIFGFLGVLIDKAIFGWAADDCMTIVHYGVNSAGISIIIYSAVEKFFTGKTDNEFDELVSFLVSVNLGSLSMVKETVSECLTLAPEKIAGYLDGVMPENIPAAVKSLITSAVQAYAVKSEKQDTDCCNAPTR